MKLVVAAFCLVCVVVANEGTTYQVSLRSGASTDAGTEGAAAPQIDEPGEGEVILPANTVVSAFTAKTLNVGNLHIENDQVMSGPKGLTLPLTKMSSFEVSGGGAVQGYTQLGAGAPAIRLVRLETKLPIDNRVPAPVPIRDAENNLVSHTRVLSVDVVLIRESKIIPNWSAAQASPYFTWWIDDKGFTAEFINPPNPTKEFMENLGTYGGTIRATVMYTPLDV